MTLHEKGINEVQFVRLYRSRKELAELLGVSDGKIREWRKYGHIEPQYFREIKRIINTHKKWILKE